MRSKSTVGLVQPALEVKVVDTETGEIVPLGETELLTRGYSVMKGYWGSRFKTREAIQDGWMHTGDLATWMRTAMSKSSAVVKTWSSAAAKTSIRLRSKTTYIAIKIRDVQIVGVPDKRYGEVLAAWIIPKEPGCLVKTTCASFVVSTLLIIRHRLIIGLLKSIR